MNIRILAMKHAMKLEAYYAHMNENGPNAVHVVAQAGIIEEYLSQGILSPESPATIGTGKTN